MKKRKKENDLRCENDNSFKIWKKKNDKRHFYFKMWKGKIYLIFFIVSYTELNIEAAAAVVTVVVVVSW